ncbi:MAG: hypothetical protein RLZZ283_376 [Candidatus Parcubacteria bacterium]
MPQAPEKRLAPVTSALKGADAARTNPELLVVEVEKQDPTILGRREAGVTSVEAKAKIPVRPVQGDSTSQEDLFDDDDDDEADDAQKSFAAMVKDFRNSPGPYFLEAGIWTVVALIGATVAFAAAGPVVMAGIAAALGVSKVALFGMAMGLVPAVVWTPIAAAQAAARELGNLVAFSLGIGKYNPKNKAKSKSKSKGKK